MALVTGENSVLPYLQFSTNYKNKIFKKKKQQKTNKSGCLRKKYAALALAIK